jgi:hypothetical protein
MFKFALGWFCGILIGMAIMSNQIIESDFGIVTQVNKYALSSKNIGYIGINNFKNVCIDDTIKLVLVKKNN